MYFGDLDACCDRGHHHPDRRHPDRPLHPHDADEVKMSIETAAEKIPAAVSSPLYIKQEVGMYICGCPLCN